MKNNYLAIIVIWIVAVLLVAMTYSFFPGFLRERAGLYNSTEYSQMFLNDNEYKNLEIEYDYVDEYKPEDGSRNQLLYVINKYSDKEEVKDNIDDKIDEEDRRNFYTEDDIYDLNDKYQKLNREYKEMEDEYNQFLDLIDEKGGLDD